MLFYHLSSCDDDTLPDLPIGTQQEQMELLVSRIEDREYVCHDKEHPDKIDDWEGVVTWDDKVQEIAWYDIFHTGGTIEFWWVPRTVSVLLLWNNGLEGSLDTEELPEPLTELTLQYNKFKGTVDLTRLPIGLSVLNLANNAFEGTANLTKLPIPLRELNLSTNSFRGSLDLTDLPYVIDYISLSNNKFRGSLDFSKLPWGLQDLHMGGNGFIGELDLLHIPESLAFLDLSKNRLTGVVVISKDRRPQINLSGNDVHVFDEDGNCLSTRSRVFGKVGKNRIRIALD